LNLKFIFHFCEAVLDVSSCFPFTLFRNNVAKGEQTFFNVQAAKHFYFDAEHLKSFYRVEFLHCPFLDMLCENKHFLVVKSVAKGVVSSRLAHCLNYFALTYEISFVIIASVQCWWLENYRINCYMFEIYSEFLN
jgi:hypothetical protein